MKVQALSPQPLRMLSLSHSLALSRTLSLYGTGHILSAEVFTEKSRLTGISVLLYTIRSA